MAFDLEKLATQIVAAHEASNQVTDLPQQDTPTTLKEAYALQDAVLQGRGVTPVGWKIGLGSETVMNAFGLNRPAAARIFGGTVFTPNTDLALTGDTPIVLEFEIAYKLSREIAPGEAVEDIPSIVESKHAAFEVIQPRLANWKDLGAHAFIGEGIGYLALILDEKPTDVDLGSLHNSISVSADGEEKVKAVTGVDGVDPDDMMRFLLSHCAEQNITLRKGEIISTGTQTAQFAVPVGTHEIEATWDGGSLKFKTHLAGI